MCNVSSPTLSSDKGHSNFGQSFLGVCVYVGGQGRGSRDAGAGVGSTDKAER